MQYKCWKRKIIYFFRFKHILTDYCDYFDVCLLTCSENLKRLYWIDDNEKQMKYLRINFARLTASLFRFTNRRRKIFDRTDVTSFDRRSRAPASTFSRTAALLTNLRAVLFTGKWIWISFCQVSKITTKHLRQTIKLLKPNRNVFIYHQFRSKYLLSINGLVVVHQYTIRPTRMGWNNWIKS